MADSVRFHLSMAGLLAFYLAFSAGGAAMALHKTLGVGLRIGGAFLAVLAFLLAASHVVGWWTVVEEDRRWQS